MSEDRRNIVSGNCSDEQLTNDVFRVRVVVTDEIISAMSLDSPFNPIHSNIHVARQHREQRVSWIPR
jgi:hypothetical protein